MDVPLRHTHIHTHTTYSIIIGSKRYSRCLSPIYVCIRWLPMCKMQFVCEWFSHCQIFKFHSNLCVCVWVSMWNRSLVVICFACLASALLCSLFYHNFLVRARNCLAHNWFVVTRVGDCTISFQAVFNDDKGKRTIFDGSIEARSIITTINSAA